MSRRGLEVWWFYGDPAPLARDNIFKSWYMAWFNIYMVRLGHFILFFIIFIFFQLYSIRLMSWDGHF